MKDAYFMRIDFAAGRREGFRWMWTFSDIFKTRWERLLMRARRSYRSLHPRWRAGSRRPAPAQKFYPDDPLIAEPTLLPTYDPQPRALSDILEILNNSLGSPGERHPETGIIPAGGVNTLGEVMDGPCSSTATRGSG